MNDFLVGLQFLTRLQIKKQLDWSEKACGGSVKFFPVIGTVLGFCYLLLGAVIYLLLPRFDLTVNPLCTGFLLLLFNIYLTGALHCDGFCDTMDGILSGREKSRILEIMKDSRVGAHGATSLILLLIGKFAMFASLPPSLALCTLFFMPVTARACMSLAVVAFPYARKEGLGKAFHEFSGAKDLTLALGYVMALLVILGGFQLKLTLLLTAASLATLWVMYCFDRHVAGLIDGLTGDVYGATAELGELIFLIFAVVFNVFLA